MSTLLSDELCERFGLGTPLEPLQDVDGAWTHRVSQLRTDRGMFAVKEMNSAADDHDFIEGIEKAFLFEKRAFEQDIAMPQPIPTVDTRSALAVVTNADDSPALVRVHEWVEGTPLHGADAVTLDHATFIGELLAHIHHLQPSHESELPPPFVFDISDWTTYVDRAEHHGYTWGNRLRELLSAIEELAFYDTSSPLGRVVMSHRDVNQTNCLSTGPCSLVLLDWDRAGPIHAALEVGVAALHWAGASRMDPDRDVLRQVLRSYVEAGGVIDVAPSDLFLGWRRGSVWWLEVNVKRVLDTPSLDNKTFDSCTFQINESLDKIARIDHSMDEWVRIAQG